MPKSSKRFVEAPSRLIVLGRLPTTPLTSNGSASTGIPQIAQRLSVNTLLIVTRVSALQALLRHPSRPKNLVALKHNEEFARRTGDLFDLNANRGSRLKENRFGERSERAVTVRDSQAGNIVDRFALILASSRSDVHAVKEAHVFRGRAAGLKEIGKSA